VYLLAASRCVEPALHRLYLPAAPRCVEPELRAGLAHTPNQREAREQP
jgi:hypothetical protein